MKLKMLFIYSGLLLVVFGCSPTKRSEKTINEMPAKPDVFRMNYFTSEGEKNVSFPVWFNDSIVRNEQIKLLRHKSFGNDSNGEAEMKVERIFSFDEQGVLKSFQRKKFYENVVVENVTFKYTDVRDDMGYAPVEIIDSLHPNEKGNYELYKKEQYNKEYIVYSNTISGDYLFCILDRKLWGTVSVDSLFNPTPNDIIQYGSPYKPYKRFQIEKLVNEKNVTAYRYYKGTSSLKRISSDTYPFYLKKSPLVAKNGVWRGYIDSTFSAYSYLNRTVSKCKRNQEKLPIKLVHKGMRSGSFEVFEYEFYDQNN